VESYLVKLGRALFIVNTILVASLVGYFWLVFLPKFQGQPIYGSMSNFLVLITACVLVGYAASSLVMLDRV